MSSWKAATFCTLVALPLPLSVAASIYLQRPVLGLGSITIATIECALYALTLGCITVPYFFNPYRRLPIPSDESFFLGHVKHMIKRPNGDYFLGLLERVPNDGLIAMRGIFQMGVLIVPTTVDGYMEVLNTKSYDFIKPVRASQLIKRVIGHGLVTAEQAEHKLQRRSVATAFTGKQIKDLAPVFWSKSEELAEILLGTLSVDVSKPAKPRVGNVDISEWAPRVTLDIIGVAGIGRDFGTVHNSSDELGKTYERLFGKEVIPFFALNIALPRWLTKILPPLEINKRVDRSVVLLRKFCHETIEERQRQMTDTKKVYTDILSSLIMSNCLNNDQLVDQLLTFLAAGHDTTSSALSWCIYLLCKHLDTQKRLRDEVQKTIRRGMEVDADLMDSMPYLHGVCMETLRLYPTVPSTGRHTVRETTICGQIIKPGTEIDICPWAINRHKELWGPDADMFKPERWIGETNSATGGASRTDFMTFLHGPRSCIGQGFAKLELKCLVSALILEFNIELQDPTEIVKPVGSVTIKPSGGMNVRLTAL